MSAPARPKSGAYGECDPAETTACPKRAPRKRPAAKPASVAAPTTKPWK